jgi:hypothetical protein
MPYQFHDQTTRITPLSRRMIDKDLNHLRDQLRDEVRAVSRFAPVHGALPSHRAVDDQDPQRRADPRPQTIDSRVTVH